MTVHLQERNPVRINQGIRDAHMRLEGFKATFPLNSGSVISWNSGDVTITHSADTLTFAGGTIVAAAGTATVPPLELQAGTNLTTAAAGAIEYDGKVFYATHAAGARGVLLTEQFASLTVNRTLSATTAQQALFDAANNSLDVQASTSYFFEALIHLSGMSATSGNFTFSLVGAGTATFTSCKWVATGFDTSTPTTAAAAGASLSASATGTGNIVTAAVGTAVAVVITGIARVAAAGTLLPSIGLTTSIAAVAQQNSFIRLRPIGANTTAAVGAWS